MIECINKKTYTPYELGKQYDTTSQEAKRTHYPHLLAPPSLRTANLPSTRPQRYLNPALWDAVTLGNKTAESQLQAYMWQTESTCNPTRTFTPDSVTTYYYDYDNRLTTVNLPTNNDTVEYTYDATGRRLTKEYTYHNGSNTDVTTYKYHYIGSQITEIEIDAIRNPGASQTVLRNEEVKIHLGANSQPISYEWVKHVGENTTQATYYYHYDIHGNVLKVTDSSENTKITYTYDTLGSILTESNPDSILNFFTFRGASQTIWEPETGLYYSGGYYRPDTGTALQGTGAPVLTNPSSGAIINAMSQVNIINRQMAIQATRAAVTAGASESSFAPPPGPGDGLTHANSIAPTPNTDTVEPIATITDGGSDNVLLVKPECSCGSWLCPDCKGKQKSPYVRKNNEYGMEDDVKTGNNEGDGTLPAEIPEWLLTDIELTNSLIRSLETEKSKSLFRVDNDNDGYDDNTGVDKNGFNKQGYDAYGNFDPAYDRDSSDDGKQYVWAIRDAQGNIVACKTKGKCNEQDTGTIVYMYNVGSDGIRENPPKLTAKSGSVDNWNKIMDSVAAGDSSVGMWDKYGRVTSGCIFMQMYDDGTCRGVFVSPGKNPQVRYGYSSDFGSPYGDIGLGHIGTTYRDRKEVNKTERIKVGDEYIEYTYTDFEEFWRFETNFYYNSYDTTMGHGGDQSEEDPTPYVGPWRWIDGMDNIGGKWNLDGLP